MKTTKLFLLSVLVFFNCANRPAQVLIGGLENPKAGAILDLNSTTKGGLILSNVTIADPELIPQNTNIFEGVSTADLDVNEELRGIMVYNDGQGTAVPAGIYIWNGYCWTKDGGAVTVTAPSISIDGTVANTSVIIAGGSLTFAVVSSQPDVSYRWYKNTIPSNSNGVPADGTNTDTSYTTPALSAGTCYFYCTATSNSCPLSNATSSLLTVTVDNPHSLPVGSGTLAGRACFDVMTGNTGAGCGTTATRQTFSADFTQLATNTQEYVFSPLGTVSNLRFYAEEDDAHTGEIIESKSYDTDLKTAHDISGEQAFTIVYKNDLNGEAADTDNYNALRVAIYTVYNDAPDGSGTDQIVKLTALIKDCQCCGAYVNAPKTQWLNFTCHNLGADELKNPFIPIADIHGDKYKFGTQSATVPMNEDQGTTGAVSNWGNRPYQNDTEDWFPSNDPCPLGWRLPTKDEWQAVINNNAPAYSTISGGTTFTGWAASGSGWATNTTTYNNYAAAIRFGEALVLPTAGSRKYEDGTPYARGNTAYYWSRTASSSRGNVIVFGSSGTPVTGPSSSRTDGFPLRCVAD
jgi:uncharacterized protein (TIGR02145 family)